MKKSKNANPTLSILIPVYNEIDTIEVVLKSVAKHVTLSHETVVIDDGSVDGTREWLEKHPKLYTQLIIHRVNQGKGKALEDGFKAAKGEICVIQDADLEYDPQEIPKLVQPILNDQADAVYGSRFVGSEPHRVAYFWHFLANKLLTFLSDAFTNLNLTDMETGYKAIRSRFVQAITITESGFGIEPELTAKLAAAQARFYEMGISYHGRTYSEGKKIGFKDFLRALYVIFKFGVVVRLKGLV